MHQLSWILRFVVLTEADQNGNHYIHPSKEILNEDSIRQLIGTNGLQTRPFVNSLDVTLSPNDLRRGTYE